MCIRHKLLAFLCLVILGFSSCVSISVNTILPPHQTPLHSNRDLTPAQRKLTEAAYSLLGSSQIRVKGRNFNFDCTGVVLACYYYAGIDLSLAFPRYTGNGVARIYHYLKDEGLLYSTDYPVPGDIIFWDNTYDRNKDGKFNDELTHIGMVTSVSESGNITYIHANYRRGIILETMNLKKPDTHRLNDQTVNSAMRMRGSPESKSWLSGQLYRAFGKAYRLTIE